MTVVIAPSPPTGDSDYAGVVGAGGASKADPGETERCADSSRVARCALIVLDASVVVELLTNGPLADSLRRNLAGSSESFIAPHLLDIEVASALRRLDARRRIDSHRSEQLLTGLAALPAERYSHIPLLGRIWELRHNFGAYDAVYIALTEATNSVLYTCDEKLSKGHRARVMLFSR